MSIAPKYLTQTDSKVEKNQDAAGSKSTYNSLWFVAAAETMRGPFTQSQLNEQIALGIVEGGDYVWRQGLGDWRVIGTLSEFFQSGSPVATKAFPTIKAPVGGIEKALDWDGKDRRQVKVTAVSLTSGVRSRWSIYDWFLAVLVCLLFSYLGLWTTQRYVGSELLRKDLLTFSGQKLGFVNTTGAESSLTFHAVAPILSAPGGIDFIQRENVWIQAFDVKIKGDLVSESQGQSVFLESDAINRLPAWSLSSDEIDPIYRRPLVFHGRAFMGPEGLRFRPASGGDPYLP